MSKPIIQFSKQQIIMLVFAIFVSGCSSLVPLDKTTEKPITDIKSIVGKWSGVGQWLISGRLPYVLFPTVIIQEDGTLILQISSDMDEYGPYTYKGRLRNGKLWTINGEYTLYEHEENRVLFYLAHQGTVEAQLKFIDNSNSLPIRKNFCKDCYFESPLNLY
jgi:hypothetical protein